MQAGKLNRRIQIQTQTAAQDAFGQPLKAWSTAYECWAAIDIQKSALTYSTSEFISKVTYRITMRWTTSIVVAAGQRVTYTEPITGIIHTYEIEAALNDQTGNRMLTLLCYELNGKE